MKYPKKKDLIGNKIVITKVSKNFPKNNSETVTNEKNKEDIEDKEDIYLKKKKVIDNLRFI